MKKIIIIALFSLLLVAFFSSNRFCITQCARTKSSSQVTGRSSDYPIMDVILKRQAHYAFSGEKISHEHLMTLLEAARWAPSSYNLQPWRFIYAHRETSAWEKLFNLMVPFNQSWAQHAGALVLVVSRKTFEWNGEPSRSHSFDTGAAVENLALQAASMGLSVHVMEGFDHNAARTALSIPDEFEVEYLIAIGKPGDKNQLPDYLQERETPTVRKPLDEIVFEGSFE